MDADDVAELPEGPLHVAIFGRKGEGKTEMAFALWDSWDGDRIVVDPNDDVFTNHPEALAECVPLTPDDLMGGRWPEHLKPEGADRLTLRYVPDHGADPDLYLEQLDRVIGLAFGHRGTLLWIDEAGDVIPVGKAGPHARKALHMGRHQDLYVLLTAPRPNGIETLAWAQADVFYLYKLPVKKDRQRIAETIGWDPDEVETAFASLDDHEYLRYVGSAHELSKWPPIPMPKRRTTAQAYMEDHDGRPAE